MRESRLKNVKVEELRLSIITDFTVENARGDDWDTIVTCHSGQHASTARTWHLHRHSIGKHKLKSKFTQEGAKPVVSPKTIFISTYSTTCLVSTWVSTYSWLASTSHLVPGSCTPCQPVVMVSTYVPLIRRTDLMYPSRCLLSKLDCIIWNDQKCMHRMV